MLGEVLTASWARNYLFLPALPTHPPSCCHLNPPLPSTSPSPALHQPFTCPPPALHLPSTSHRKKEALQEKELGNEAYKKKQFDEAIAHYDR